MHPADTPDPPPWAIFVRSAADNPASIDHQVSVCTRWLLDRGVEASVTVVDPAVLIHRVSEGRFAGVVVSNLDRLSRNFAEAVHLIGLCAAHQTPLHAVDQPELRASVTVRPALHNLSVAHEARARKIARHVERARAARGSQA
jgi:hypothetical protein